VVVALVAASTPISDLAEMLDIGTLFAFVLVSIGVVVPRRTRPDLPRAFRTPWVPFCRSSPPWSSRASYPVRAGSRRGSGRPSASASTWPRGTAVQAWPGAAPHRS